MKRTTQWEGPASPRSTHMYRQEEGASLCVSRVQGAIKHKVPLPWQWSVSKGNQFRGPAYAERRGRCATEAEARQAADDAAPQVLAAFAVFGVES